MKTSREKAKEICTKSQYGEATWWEILQLNVYLLFYKDCAQFSAKNSKLTSLCEQANMQVISEEDKEAMKKELEKQL
ncbi:hypothetical protein [Croceitalea rosinachiae]|uniref:Uncharacterized protein n=1 Tax=Croceitalea rosinachiae TaxID=3075596 RepID=A0ABU3ACJ1_9FLAO|nr:hypothetical protein [Croceitalea sp. F388]MDT0607898.1 hypothetical protein [Croceitalea sp. F388]